MDEIYDHKLETITASKSRQEEGLDLMGTIIRHSSLISSISNHGKAGEGLIQGKIMGNYFLIFLAGHETAANSIHFAVLFRRQDRTCKKSYKVYNFSHIGNSKC
jgi:hypothetical protein